MSSDQSGVDVGSTGSSAGAGSSDAPTASADEVFWSKLGIDDDDEIGSADDGTEDSAIHEDAGSPGVGKDGGAAASADDPARGRAETAAARRAGAHLQGARARPSLKGLRSRASRVRADARRPAQAPGAGRSGRAGRRRQKVRRVHRVVSHVEIWSVLKVASLFAVCTYIVLLVAGYLLWRAADRVGTIDGIEGFMEDAGGYDRFQIFGDVIFRASAVLGIVLGLLVVFGVVLGAILFNLISDLTGGIRMTVIDEDLVVMPIRPAGAAGSSSGPVAQMPPTRMPAQMPPAPMPPTEMPQPAPMPRPQPIERSVIQNPPGPSDPFSTFFPPLESRDDGEQGDAAAR